MDFWGEHSDNLEAALMDQPKALLLHFLQTATPEQVAKFANSNPSIQELAGFYFDPGSKVISSIQFTLMERVKLELGDNPALEKTG
mgnify:CR=1 FL=1